MPDPHPLGLKISHVPEIACMLKIEHEPLARAFGGVSGCKILPQRKSGREGVAIFEVEEKLGGEGGSRLVFFV